MTRADHVAAVKAKMKERYRHTMQINHNREGYVDQILDTLLECIAEELVELTEYVEERTREVEP